MPRNLDNRVELAVPIEDPALRGEVLETVELCLADNHNAWDLDGDGVWTRVRPPEPGATINAQEELMRLPSAPGGRERRLRGRPHGRAPTLIKPRPRA